MVIPYEPYVEDEKIYIRNENDVYEEFINKKELENKINNMQYLSILGSVGDNDTKTFPVNSRKVYLFINSHIFQRCIILITVFNDIIETDIIYKSSDNAVPTISLNSNELTIKSQMQCRGKLIRLNNLICA